MNLLPHPIAPQDAARADGDPVPAFSGTLREAVLQSFAARADQPQITVLRRSSPPLDLTGNDLLAGATSLLAGLNHQLGPGRHTLVVALAPGETFLSVLFAAVLGGHTIVPVALPRPGSQSDRLMHIIRDCSATAVLCAGGTRDVILRQFGAASAGASDCPVIDLDRPTQAAGPRNGSAVKSAASGASRPVLIQYTSGSTRMPKGVRIFGEQILANAEIAVRDCGMDKSTRFVNWLPHYHDMGLIGGIFFPLLVGGHSIQMNPLEVIRKPAAWLRTISDYRATFSGGPAFAYADCLRRITPEECVGLDLSSWTGAFCGAEPIPAGLLPAFEARFGQYGLPPHSVFGCYGMAEITLIAAGAARTDGALPLPPAGCSGVHACLLSETMRSNLAIVDPVSRQEMQDGDQGEIWLRGPSKGQGYVNLPEESSATFHATLAGASEAEWLRTGDLGVVQAGHLYVTGRLKDIVIVNGRNVAASEIEWLAASLDDALNPMAAAAFAPNQAESGIAVLLIELKPGRSAPDHPSSLRAAIERAVTGEWGIRLSDVRIVPRGRLDRTSSGKIRRQVIASAYRNGIAPPAYDRDAGVVSA